MFPGGDDDDGDDDGDDDDVNNPWSAQVRIIVSL